MDFHRFSSIFNCILENAKNPKWGPKTPTRSTSGEDISELRRNWKENWVCRIAYPTSSFTWATFWDESDKLKNSKLKMPRILIYCQNAATNSPDGLLSGCRLKCEKIQKYQVLKCRLKREKLKIPGLNSRNDQPSFVYLIWFCTVLAKIMESNIINSYIYALAPT